MGLLDRGAVVESYAMLTADGSAYTVLAGQIGLSVLTVTERLWGK